MSTINRRASKRRKRRPERALHTPSASEERHLHQAIQNSKLDRSRQGDLDIPWGPTFYPTVEEMEASPLDFMEKIRPVAQRYGIYKIVPPKGWNPHPFSKCSRRSYIRRYGRCGMRWLSVGYRPRRSYFGIDGRIA
jgi:hypothetical protein